MKQLFELGQCVMTHGIAGQLDKDKINSLVIRHVSGDFGNLCKEDIETNNYAIKNSERILSSYEVDSQKVYIITEWDRSYTTVLFASEY